MAKLSFAGLARLLDICVREAAAAATTQDRQAALRRLCSHCALRLVRMVSPLHEFLAAPHHRAAWCSLPLAVVEVGGHLLLGLQQRSCQQQGAPAVAAGKHARAQGKSRSPASPAGMCCRRGLFRASACTCRIARALADNPGPCPLPPAHRPCWGTRS